MRLEASDVMEIAQWLEKRGRLLLEKEYPHHGSTTVFDHSLHVACKSLQIVHTLHLHVDERSLVVGALLHDYFLYDWHEKVQWHRLHGIRHPRFALDNALEDYQLNDIERDIIRHHMFPGTFVCPHTLEGWVVCLADKLCAVGEGYSPFRRGMRHSADDVPYGKSV